MPALFSNPAETNPTIGTSTNRITSTGWQYDRNTAAEALGRGFTYDGENKQVLVKNSSNVTVGEYWYDGDGKRVKKWAFNPSNNETEVTVFVYDASGKLIEEYSTVVATLQTAEVAYLTNDHLGSPRINTDRDGDVISRHDYHPFGEEILTSERTTHPDYTPDSVRKQFTGYERDEENGLDFAKARYYSSKLGRFLSPDEFEGGPEELFEFAENASDNPTFYADFENPQSLNKYQYTYNNPYRFNDPTGHCPPITSCLANPAIADRINRITDAVIQTAVVTTIVAGVAVATDTVVDSLSRSANAGVGDASCPACTSSQRMGESLMNQNAQSQSKSPSGQSGEAKATAGGSVRASNAKNSNAKGIPNSQVGPSGKPKIHVVKHPTQKRAKDAARNEGQGKPARDNNPRKGGSHFHPTDPDGSRKKGIDNVHHEFPLKKGKLPE